MYLVRTKVCIETQKTKCKDCGLFVLRAHHVHSDDNKISFRIVTLLWLSTEKTSFSTCSYLRCRMSFFLYGKNGYEAELA